MKAAVLLIHAHRRSSAARLSVKEIPDGKAVE
jgi:hypothetical protein